MKTEFVTELEDGSIFHLELQIYSERNTLEYCLLLLQASLEKEINQVILSRKLYKKKIIENNLTSSGT